VEADAKAEARRARLLLGCILGSGVPRAMIIGPNNDPGAGGILGAWREVAGRAHVTYEPDVGRGLYLGLLREAAMLVGNSSSGIIEAGSFGTPVIDVGPRQKGRERGGNVRTVSWSAAAIGRAIDAVWAGGRAPRIECENPYGGGGAGRRIADVLVSVSLDTRLRRKLIAY
jgi:UDP-N-acetylglucosamine 2-epimerase